MRSGRLVTILMKYVILPAALVLFLIVVCPLFYRRHLQSRVLKETRITSPDGIESLEKIKLGGIDQWILIRGWDQTNPVLLHLHGGPGSADIAIARFFDTKLVKHFVVVHWDQRGAGKSYSPDIPPESMTREQFVADIRDLADMLRKRFGVERIYLVGHSWGSEIGALAAAKHPELFHAYVGVAQVVEESEQERISYEFVLERATKAGNQEALKELQQIGPPPYDDVSELLVQRKWLERFGGVSRSEKTEFAAMIRMGLTSPDYSLYDARKFFRGQDFSSSNMYEESRKTNLFEQVPRIDVPVYFFTGRHDYNSPFEEVERYYEALDAPQGKHFIWFENAAHMIPYEATDEYADALINRVLKETSGK